MTDYNPHLKRFLLPYEDTLLELLIRYGLYFGAVFQIACLISILIYHRKFFDGVTFKDDHSDMECSENSPQVTPRRPHRPRKQERKKRR